MKKFSYQLSGVSYQSSVIGLTRQPKTENRKLTTDNRKFGFTLIKHSEVSSKGFTLIELLIVIVLIGILSTIGLENFQNAQKKGRDAQRKSDLKQVQNALEAYNNDKGGYPLSSINGKIMGIVDISGCDLDQWRLVIRGCDSPCTADAAGYSSACDYTGDGVIDIHDAGVIQSVMRSGGAPLSWGTDAFAVGSTVYMEELPTDPTGSPQYCYNSTDGSKYQLFAKLENANDPQVVTGLLSCGGQSYNFGVSSPNAV